MSNCCCNKKVTKKVSPLVVASVIIGFVIAVFTIYFATMNFTLLETGSSLSEEMKMGLIIGAVITILLAISYILFGIFALVGKCKCLCSKGWLICSNMAYAINMIINGVLSLYLSRNSLTGVDLVNYVLLMGIGVGALVLFILSFILPSLKKKFRLIGISLQLGYMLFLFIQILSSSASGQTIDVIASLLYMSFFILEIIVYTYKKPCIEEESCTCDDGDKCTCGCEDGECCCGDDDCEYYDEDLEYEDDKIYLLTSYKELLDKEAITKEEYEIIKKRILEE